MNWKSKRTLSFLAWMILLVVMITTMPDLNKLVVEKGQITIPSTSESEIGSKYVSELNTGGEPTYPFVIVFNREDGLTEKDFHEIENVLETIQNDDSISILDSLIHTDSEQAEKQLISEDGTTVIAQLSISEEDGTAKSVSTDLHRHLKDLEMDTYVTGSDLVISDFAASTQEGIKKTEVIAIVFILVILILIFKSPIVPFVSLASVGISYVISLSIIALLVEHFDFPFSNFTQVFLVVVLFGVGTDYNILLFTRFKEELAKSGHVLHSITATYKTAGKTVIYSGLAVLVGFVALFLAKFQMYQATGATAIGIAVLLTVLITLNPFFMGLFGVHMFWPAKEVKGHGDNKLWGLLSRFSFMRPILSLFFIAVLTIPFILHYSNTLNYNDLVEISDKYESKQAITVIEEHYDAGFSSPASLVIKGKDLATSESLAELDGLANVIEQVEGVAKVYSVTRPEGEKIPELYLDEQSGTLNEGLTEANEGIKDIQSGFSEAEGGLSEPQDLSSMDNLIDGTLALKNGAGELEQALQSLTNGLDESKSGAGQIEDSLTELSSKVGELKQGLTVLSANYEQLSGGFNQFNQVFDQSIQGLNNAKQGYGQIEALMTSAASNANDSVENQTVLQIAKQAQKELTQAVAELTEGKEKYAALTAGFAQANDALQDAISGAAQIESGTQAIATGAGELEGGLAEASSGAEQMTTESGRFEDGLNEVNDGQEQLKDNLVELQNQMSSLAEGLKESNDGLDEIYSGLDDANDYLADLNKQNQQTFFIPQEVLEGEEFSESLSKYMNEEASLTSMTIILDVNPYTEEAMEIVQEVQQVKDSYIATSSLEDASGYLAGKTMQSVDLQNISQADFIRSAIVMLIGVMLILLWVTRSAFQSAIIIISLIVTNFAALGLTEWMAKNLLGHEALSWNVPFFTFIMIVTLGVDYSIFFMMRYNETKELGLSQVLPAAREMGGVVLSAAIILGGTFAALIPSGIITLIQVAIAVMIGLVLLSVVIMPVLLPACFGLVNKIQKKKDAKN